MPTPSMFFRIALPFYRPFLLSDPKQGGQHTHHETNVKKQHSQRERLDEPSHCNAHIFGGHNVASSKYRYNTRDGECGRSYRDSHGHGDVYERSISILLYVASPDTFNRTMKTFMVNPNMLMMED